jgi:PAS domain S-box-containing protein
MSVSPAQGHRDLPHLEEALTRAPDSEEDIGARKDARLAQHLLAGRTASDFGQWIGAGLSVFFFWTEIATSALLAWWAVFTLLGLLRFSYRNRAIAVLDDPARITAGIRWDITVSALAWAALPFLLWSASNVALALLLVCFAGMIAAATSTMIADTRAFRLFSAILHGPLIAVIVAGGLDRVHVSFLLMIALYAPFMIWVHRRAHGLLRSQIETNELLRNSEDGANRRMDFLDALFSHTPTSVAVFDEFGRVVHGNPAFERVVGRPVDELMGCRVSDLIENPDAAAEATTFLRALEPGRRDTIELDLTAADGRPTWMQLSGTRADSHASGLSIVSGIDISDQVATRAALEAARKEAEGAVRSKSSFLASMSHEIRTPMNGILGMLGLLADTPLTDEQRESVDVIQRSADALLRILNDILDVSKIEAGQLDLETIGFDLPQLARETARMFTPLAWSRSTEVVLDIAELEHPYVLGDPMRIRQVLSNLLSNAVKFTEDGEVILRVRPGEDRGGRPDPTRIAFSVSDTGIGIPEDKHEKIFGEFEQADQSTTRTHGGTGLGLTISRRLVALMGGQLTLRSRVGEGSTFSFDIPLPAAEKRAGDRDPGSVNLQGLRFLVVDDSDAARRIVTQALATEGALFDEASDAESGLRLLASAIESRTPYAAVILDHLMPDQDGFDFARAAAKHGDPSAAPILMLTSSADSAQRAQAREVGIGGYLAKPVSRPSLVRAIGELLTNAGRSVGERRLVTDATLSRHTILRILVAEDNTVNQHVAKAMLSKRGHDVDIVGNGALAVEAVLAKPYDLVLMDIQMPVMDGHDATRRIRSNPRFASLPIVAVTAHAFAEERTRCEESGMNDFLAKPMKPAELFAVLERWAPSGNDAEQATPDPAAESSSAGPHTEENTMTQSSVTVDVEAFRAMMRDAGIEHIVDATLELYARETPIVLQRIRDAVEGNDAGEVHSAAHMLKSSSANIRADHFAELLLRLETAGRSEDIRTIAALMPEVEDEYAAVMRQITETATV